MERPNSQLRSLNLGGNGITDEAIEQIIQANPNCKVYILMV